MTKIVIIGSGWGASSFLKYLDLDDNNDVLVISPNDYFIYTPLLINSIFKNFNLSYSLNNLYPIKHKHSRVKNIDFKKQEVYLEQVSESPISYDYLILSHGADNNTFNIPGVQECCHHVKNLDNNSNTLDLLKKLPDEGNIIVIGASLTGTELVGHLIDQEKFKISVIDSINRPLPSFDSKISSQVSALWEKNQVTQYFAKMVTHVDSKNVYLDDQSKIPYDVAFWCGGLKNNELTQRINKLLNYNDSKGIPVSKSLEVFNTTNCYAIGDCTSTNFPKTAQVAYQQGKYLADRFNSNFDKKNTFEYKDKGQVCYFGKGRSAYQNNYIHSEGKLIGYLNTIIYAYNAINLDQTMILCKNLWKGNN